MERNQNLYQFGPFCLNEEERILLRDGRIVPLPAKVLSTLAVLVRNQGHLVDKDTLMELVWPDEVVEEGNLAKNVFTLRKALGQTADGGQYIETIPRRGYRFLAEVIRQSHLDPPAIVTTQPTARRIEGAIDGRPTSLAVLPFVNLTGSSKVDQLSDKITESIINRLSQVKRLRVMSRSAVFRYKGKEQDAHRFGTELGVDTVLFGTMDTHDGRLLISTELVDVANGWQLWGKSYECRAEEILDLQDDIAGQISATLLRLNREEQQRLTKRYTEIAEAYEAYVKGRRSWAKHSRLGLEQAIECFRDAIDLDPNYALAYAGIVDCYLRLATNYLPPGGSLPKTAAFAALQLEDPLPDELQAALETRFTWDIKAMERELKRASEFSSGSPTVYQWHAAYLFARNLYLKTAPETNASQGPGSIAGDDADKGFEKGVPAQFRSTSLTPTEEVQIFCIIAREQIEVGNYEAGYAVLSRWWTFGEWPRLEGLSPSSLADLLFTIGKLAGFLASMKQLPRGQKHPEALLNGAIALFEQLGLRAQVAQSQIELAICYYRESIFNLARPTLLSALESLSDEDRELRTIGMIKLAGVENQAGRLHDALSRLDEAAGMVDSVGPLAIAHYQMDLATLFQVLGKAEMRDEYFDRAHEHYGMALLEYEAVGNHRYATVIEADIGYLLLTLKRLDDAEPHLVRARDWFAALGDERRRALVDESLAEFYVASGQLDLAEQAIAQAVKTLDTGGQESYFAQTLTTQGIVLCKLKRYREAKRVLDRAHRVGERCGDFEGAGAALLIVIEEMCDQLEADERQDLGTRLRQLLAGSQKTSTLARLEKCLQLIASASAEPVK